MPKLTGILIGFLMVGLIVTGLGAFIAEGTNKYARTQIETSNINFSKLDFTADIKQIQEQARGNVSKMGTSTTTITDILGTWVSNGMSVIKITTGSMDIFTSLVTEMAQITGIESKYSKIFVVAFLIIFIFGVVVSAIMKVDL